MVSVKIDFSKRDFSWVVPLVFVLVIGVVVAVSIDPAVMGHGDIWVDDDTGYVGIGIESPYNKLQVEGSIALATQYDSIGDGGRRYIGIPGSNPGSWGGSGAYIGFTQGGTNGVSNDIRFYTHKSGVFAGEAMRISEGGNVGIGTSTPGAKLHVAGDLIVDGALTVSGGGGGGFGSYVSKSKDTRYGPVACDGFVIAVHGGSDSSMIGYAHSTASVVDSSSSSAERIRSWGRGMETMTMPVKKGDYWKVTVANQYVSWIPFGTGC